MAKKVEKDKEPEQPITPTYIKDIAPMVLRHIGGETKGFIRLDVRHLNGHNFRINVWCNRKETTKKVCGIADEYERATCTHSYYITFSPGGEIITSHPPLPEIK